MRRYTQLIHEQRYQILALKKAGLNQTETALIVGVHKSTICREFKRNTGLRGYRSKQAHRLSVVRCQGKHQPRINIENWSLVSCLLREEWSPEQISLWLAAERSLKISHE